MLRGDQPLPVRRCRHRAGARLRRRRRLLAARLGQAVAEIDRRADACGQPEKRPVFARRLPAERGRRQSAGPSRTAGRRRPRRLRQRRLSGKSGLAAAKALTLLPLRNVIGKHHDPTSRRNLQGLRHPRHRRQVADRRCRAPHRPGPRLARRVERGQKAIAIGRDGRLSGPELAGALADGICAAGVDVIDIGCVPTPVTYFAAYRTRHATAASRSPAATTRPTTTASRWCSAAQTLFGDADPGPAPAHRSRPTCQHGQGKRRQRRRPRRPTSSASSATSSWRGR